LITAISSDSESSRMEVDLQPYEWVSGDRDGGFSIRVYAHLKDEPGRPSERVLLRIDDYQPFCRLELPSVLYGKPITWSVDALKAYVKWLRGMLRDHQPVEGGVVYKELEKVYGYKKQQKYPFLICRFENEEAMRHCVNLINKQAYHVDQLGLIKARVWETSITTIHRLVTDLKLGYAQWFRAKVTEVAELDKISWCEHEYIAAWQDVRPLDSEETQNWSVSPKTCAIDIECYSHNHRAMPNRDYVQDKVFAISYLTERIGPMGDKVPRKRLLVVGPCDDIPGAEVIRYNHEISMLHGLTDLIKETDPTLIITYNGSGFDFPYMEARMKLYMQEWRPCGLLKDQATTIKTSSWKSSAYGFMKISTIECEGRLNIDMYPIIKREHKLDRYTLDHVSKTFLDGEGKNDIKAKEMFEIYAAGLKAQEENEKFVAIQRKLEETMKDVDELKKVLADASATQTRIAEALQKSKQEMARVGLYCLQDSYLCIKLLKKLNTWIMLIEMSVIVSITAMSVWTRGQQVRVQNKFYRYSYHEGFVIDERPGSKEGFKGGKVQEPVVGKYRNILIFDFASLYPSIIRAFNICYTTLVPPESNIPDEMCHVIAWIETDDDGKETPYRYRFIKAEYYKGILPRMCEDLVNERNRTRKLIKPQNDPVLNITLNTRQNGLKVCANSIFGALGVMEGRMPLPEGARCITALGRQLITIAANHVREKHNGQIVYGDTDSIMVNMNITDPHDCLRLGDALSKEITALYPKPLSLEFERAISLALFIKKKFYAGVPLAIIRLIEGDTIQRVAFSDEHRNDELALYKFTMIRDGKTKTKYVGIPIAINIAAEPLELGQIVKVGKVEEKATDAPYILGDRTISGKRAIAGLPLSSEGGPSADPADLMKKGIVLARRDNCVWLREAYEAVLFSIMFGKPLRYTLDLVDAYVMKMMTRQVPLEKMSITRAIGSNYKPNSTYFLKLFADNLRRQGQVIGGGERIDYVIVRSADPNKNEKMGDKMRLIEMFWANSNAEPMDRVHYVEKMFMKPLSQILYLGYKDEVDAAEIKFKPQIRRRNKIYTYLSPKYITTTVKLLRKKEELCKFINDVKPHHPRYHQTFIESFA